MAMVFGYLILEGSFEHQGSPLLGSSHTGCSNLRDRKHWEDSEGLLFTALGRGEEGRRGVHGLPQICYIKKKSQKTLLPPAPRTLSLHTGDLPQVWG